MVALKLLLLLLDIFKRFGKQLRVVLSLDDGCPEVLFVRDWSLICLFRLGLHRIYLSQPFLSYSPSVHTFLDNTTPMGPLKC